MSFINKEIKYHDGTSVTIDIISNDNYQVNLNKNYVLANKNIKTNKFQNSLLGRDIGIGSSGFASIATLATIISVVSFVAVILAFRV